MVDLHRGHEKTIYNLAINKPICRVITLLRAQTSLKLMLRVHLRLISSTCVPSIPTPNIWRRTIERGTPGRGEALRFMLVNSWLCGSTMRSSWRACNSCSEHCYSRREKMTILSTRFKNKKSGTGQRSASSSLEASRTQRLRFWQ
jgi:hypothetical protein